MIQDRIIRYIGGHKDGVCDSWNSMKSNLAYQEWLTRYFLDMTVEDFEEQINFPEQIKCNFLPSPESKGTVTGYYVHKGIDEQGREIFIFNPTRSDF